jgi:hypothetical protein
MPGLSLPKGLDPLFVVYSRCLEKGTSEQREVAAHAISEAMDVASDEAMKTLWVRRDAEECRHPRACGDETHTHHPPPPPPFPCRR